MCASRQTRVPGAESSRRGGLGWQDTNWREVSRRTLPKYRHQAVPSPKLPRLPAAFHLPLLSPAHFGPIAIDRRGTAFASVAAIRFDSSGGDDGVAQSFQQLHQHRLRSAAAAIRGVGAVGANPPTFTKDIAPIFQAKCESCHRPDQMAPMSLVTYEEVRPWVRSIAARISGRQMPPWHIDKTVGIQKFKNDRSLSDDQIDTIVKWAAAGAPKGDPKDLPPPARWSDDSKWQEAASSGRRTS